MLRTTVMPEAGAMYADNLVMAPKAERFTGAGTGSFSLKGVLAGEAAWTIGSQRFRVAPGDWLIVERGQAYEIAVDTLEPSQTFVVWFADALSAQVASTRLNTVAALLDDPDARTPDELPIAHRLWSGEAVLSAAAARAAEAIGQATDQGRWDAILRSLLDACADLAATAETEAARIAAAKASTRAELHRRVLRGRAVLEDAAERSFDLDAAAREACLAPHHFHRTFRAAFDETPYRFVMRRRLERARRLLEATELPVAEVCAEVGYESLPSFTAAFGRLMGESPAAYRADFRKRG